MVTSATMENAKAFQDRNIVGICEYMSNYCATNINSSTSISSYSVLPFYNFFPVFLVYIFGSPNTRGWIQTETQPAQDIAIKNLLSVSSPFIQALEKLSVYPEYSYDLVTASLPADIQRVLTMGATELLPRVYTNCLSVNVSSGSNPIDLRAAATKQSTLLPNGTGRERVIRLNMIQLYIFYFLSAPTWEPLRSSPTSFMPYGSTANGMSGFSTNTSYMPSFSTNSSNSSLQYQIAGNLRSINLSVYPIILEEYFEHFIPAASSNVFPEFIGTFFLDACVELWIRTRWVAEGQKLSPEYMRCITAFVKYITRQDLRKLTSKTNLVMAETYRTVKDELYMLISRLALNWSKDNDYLDVVDLWAIWAAPWKLGLHPSSSDKMTYTPITHGWAHIIMDNIPFYVLLVNILLQRTGTFMYKDPEQQQPQQQYKAPTGMSYSTSPFTYGTTGADASNIRGNFRILYRIINVLKAEGLVDYLSHIEEGLKYIKSNASAVHQLDAGSSMSKPLDPYKYLSNICYNTEQMDFLVTDKLTSAYELLVQINDGAWVTRGLYSNDQGTRSKELIKTINSIRDAIIIRENNKSGKAAVHVTQLTEAYQLMCTVFKIEVTSLALPSSNQHETGQSQPPQQQYQPKFAGTRTDGFLTPEERQAILEGKMFCTPDNVQPLGIRAKTVVRTYEFPWMVDWILKVDPKLNYYYNYYLPEEKRPGFFPNELTIRPWASRQRLCITALLTRSN
ncbi:hypothetical protein A0J61_00171, partial [Choanephora cucurbitarum]